MGDKVMDGRDKPTSVRFNLVDTAHGVDSSRSDAFRDESDMRGASAVPHQNTVFRQITKLIPWGVLDRLIATSGADARVRRLSTGDQLLAMIFAQLAGARSIRHLEAMLESPAHDAITRDCAGCIARRWRMPTQSARPRC